MQLNDLKQAWAAHGTLLERSLSIDERLLREQLRHRVRRALAPYALWRALEVALGIALLVAVVPVLAAHPGEARYLVGAGALVVYTFGITALCAYQLVHSLRFDYGGAVTAIQRGLESLDLLAYQTFKWALLGGVLLWLPALLVVFEALTGVEGLARVELAVLACNLAFGIAVLALGQLLSKKYLEGSELQPWARRLAEALSDRALRSAAERLAELAQFEREQPPPS